MALDVSLNPALPCGGTPPIPLCVPALGGGQICMPTGAAGWREISAFMRTLSAQLNPMAPIFRLISIVLDLLIIIKAIPQLLVFNPQPFVKGVQALVIDISYFVQFALFPPLMFAQMVRGYLRAIQLMLLALKARLLFYVQLYARIAAALAAAQASGNGTFIFNAGCAKSNADLAVQRLANELAGLGLLIRVLNGFVCLLTGSPIAALPAFNGDLGVIGEAIQIAADEIGIVILLIPDVAGISFGGDQC